MVSFHVAEKKSHYVACVIKRVHFFLPLQQTRDGWSNDDLEVKILYTVHFRGKNCQTIPPETLNMFYIPVIHTDNAQMSFVLVALCQPGGAAINFSKSARNQNRTTLLL